MSEYKRKQIDEVILQDQLKAAMIGKRIEELKEQGACYCKELNEKRAIHNPKGNNLGCDLCAQKIDWEIYIANYDYESKRKKRIEESVYE